VTRTVLRGGQVFDGTGSAPFVSDVAIEQDRIVEVGPDLMGDEAIAVHGMLVAPGLIDCHVHTVFENMDFSRVQNEPFSMQFYTAMRNLGRLLDCGVTTIRDAGGADLGVKTAVESGLIEGPRMLISITPLSQTGGHLDGWNVHGDLQRLLVPHPGRPDCVVDGVDGMRSRVRELVRAGADTVKVCASGGVISTRDDPHHPQFSPRELEVCVEEANAAGRHVMAHAHSAAGVKQAIQAGVRSIEHGVFIDDECIELLRSTSTWLVPTLMAPASLVRAIEQGMVVTPEVETKARATLAVHLEAVERAAEAGVRIAMGTDSGLFEHGASPTELSWLVRAGMSKEQALRSATARAAELLELSDVGTVSAGAVADLVVVGGDYWDFENFRENLRLVVKDGVVCRDYR